MSNLPPGCLTAGYLFPHCSTVSPVASEPTIRVTLAGTNTCTYGSSIGAEYVTTWAGPTATLEATVTPTKEGGATFSVGAGPCIGTGSPIGTGAVIGTMGWPTAPTALHES